MRTDRGCLEIDFDYCVVAIGTRYPSPIGAAPYNLMMRRLELMCYFNNIRESQVQMIIVKGGGYVGVEVATVLKEYFDENSVRLNRAPPKIEIWTRGNTICPNLNPQARSKVAENLDTKGIKVVTSVEVPSNFSEGSNLNVHVIDCSGVQTTQNKQLYSPCFQQTENG